MILISFADVISLYRRKAQTFIRPEWNRRFSAALSGVRGCRNDS